MRNFYSKEVIERIIDMGDPMKEGFVTERKLRRFKGKRLKFENFRQVTNTYNNYRYYKRNSRYKRGPGYAHNKISKGYKYEK